MSMNKEQYDQLFPPIDNLKIESHIKNSICLFYFNCCRFYDKQNQKIQNNQENKKQKKSLVLFQFLDALVIAIQHEMVNNNQYLIYLNILFRMMFQTRDVMYGKGERDMFYMMFCCFYKHYPALTISGVRQMLQDSSLACWSDVKYLCDYVRGIQDDYFTDEQKNSIYSCLVGIMLYQFDNDYGIWEKSFQTYLNFPEKLERPNARVLISFAAKWIPRESKKFDWLHERIVYQWNLIHRPYLFQNMDHYCSVITKCKKEFRKRVSGLNRELDTLEIKQCNHSWEDIDPSQVPFSAMMSQKNAFSDVQHLKEHFYSEETDLGKSVKTSHLNVGVFVKKGFELCAKSLTDRVCAQREWLNKAWKQNVLLHFGDRRGHLLPIVNVSWDVDESVRNNALGMAILMAQISTDVHRIVLCEYSGKCVDLNIDCDFMTAIGRLYYELEQLHPTSYDGKIISYMLNDGLQMVDENMCFVVLGDGHFLMNHPLELRRNKKIQLVYWNVGRETDLSFNDEDLDRVNSGEILYLSGCSGVMLRTLVAMAPRKMDTFEYLSKTLNAQRYAIYGELMNYEMGRVLYGC